MVVALAPVRQRLRIPILLSLSIYCMLLRRRQEELSLFIFGMLLADLERRPQTLRNPLKHEHFRRIAAMSAIVLRWLIFIFGLYLLSWPPNLGYKSPAYKLLAHLDRKHNHWHNVGACLTLYAVLRIDSLKRFLSTKVVLYLGRISFALYCVHYLVNLVFGRLLLDLTWSLTGKDTVTRYQLGFLFGFALTTPLVILASHVFYIGVDITSIRLSKFIQQKLSC
jgi:peptidoglycan/LPS O-acetylase OafA/YrhL